MRLTYLMVLSLGFAGCTNSPLAPSRPDMSASIDGTSPILGVRSPLADAAAIAGNGVANSALAALRRATAGYHDVSAAIADGYLAPDAAACVESPAGAMGVHSVNPGLAGETVVDPLRPEVLLYLPKSGGGFRLVGVEYFVPLLLRNTNTGQVAPWFSLAPWPANYVVVNPAPSLFGQTFHGFMPGHEPGMPWHYDLHAWAWSPNPNGDFEDFNPRLSCGGAP